MAASTAGAITLRNQKTGKVRIERFTMTPSDGEYVTFTSNNQTYLLIEPEGEDIIDFQVNNDGVTTVNHAKFTVNGSDIKVRPVLAFYAADNAPAQRLVAPIGIGGSKQLQISVHA